MELKKSEIIRKAIALLAIISSVAIMIYFFIGLLLSIDQINTIKKEIQTLYGSNVKLQSLDSSITIVIVVYLFYILWELAFIIPGIISLKNRRLCGGVLMIVFAALSIVFLILGMVLFFGRINAKSKTGSGTTNVEGIVVAILIILLRIIIISLIAYYKHQYKYNGIAPQARVENDNHYSIASPIQFNDSHIQQNRTINSPESRKRYCRYCGKVVPSNAKFCENCGMSLL